MREIEHGLDLVKIERLISLLFLLFAAPLFAGQININGTVLSDSGIPLASAEIRVNETSALSDVLGQFSVSVPSADIYVLRLSAADHFPMIHSFSALELNQSGEGNAASLPGISLVERKEGRVMLAFGGDAMAGRRFSKPYAGEPVLVRKGHELEDTAALFQFMAPYLQLADYMSLNLETQVMKTKPEGNAPKSYVFFTPPETLHSLANAGVDHVTVANNHIFDYLSAGLDSTIEALDTSPLAWSGAGRTEAESLQAYRTEVGGNSLSYVGFLGWAGNFWPNQVAQGLDKGGAAFGTADNVRNTIRREVEQGYLPVVQYHGSREYTDEPTLATETRLKTAIDEGAILAIAHHPHITQGFEIYKGKLIAYSMGNFIFDQYQSATQRSFLLYVWMDGERFHRAEVMPLHIKGYVPMPATDTVRQAVLKRVNELSSRRNVFVQVSGGHAVISPRAEINRAAPGRTVLVPAANDGLTVWPVEQPAWFEPIESITVNEGQAEPVLLGMDLLPTGHFESHYLNGAPDRTWLQNEGLTIISDDHAPSGTRVMQLLVPAGQKKGRLGTRTFDQTFEPGTPTTFIVKAWANAPARVIAYEQWRKRNESRLEALENAKLRPIGELELKAGDWQELRFDFDSPRVTAFSYRIVVEVTPLDSGKDFEGRFDDISLIEWLGPPISPGKIPSHINVLRASHIGLVKAP